MIDQWIQLKAGLLLTKTAFKNSQEKNYQEGYEKGTGWIRLNG